ncbi:aldo/keto reductase [uncultured Veillonella sp.]|uniref:aldo/keto reductase n=1 Tax=uncultured Veillonella sp. TaxID=159268 RepID=UPI0025EB63DF|nr:aldo/keto reductase [uncultured Veillonella sp.]MDY3973319.1 aldo/keto reductase [Veillonella caviae]
MIKNLADRVELNNGTQIPGLGLGVFQVPAEVTAEVVKNGILNGYRSIDTAQIYGNEKETGEGIRAALKELGLQRDDIFITTKIWNYNLSYEEALKAYEASLEALGVEYVDLYLIHWPGNDSYEESWKAMETLYKAGKIKAIGVSNFQVHHLERLASFATVVPVLNQVELHPRLQQHELRAYAAAHNIKIQAWAPLMQGELLHNEEIAAIAKAHNKSIAQVILRWHIQQELLLNVKSLKASRMIENSDIFDFVLTDAEMDTINALDAGTRVGPDPDVFDMNI